MATLTSGPEGSGNAIHFLNIVSYLHEKERIPGEIFVKGRSFTISQLPSLSCCIYASNDTKQDSQSCILLIHLGFNKVGIGSRVLLRHHCNAFFMH